MKRPTLKVFLRARRFTLAVGLIGSVLILWVSWIPGLVFLGLFLIFGYGRWDEARLCCACDKSVLYSSNYCPACGKKFIEE